MQRTRTRRSADAGRWNGGIDITDIGTIKTKKRRVTRIAVTIILVLLAFPVTFFVSIILVSDIARYIEFRLAKFDQDTWQSCTGKYEIARSPRRKMAIDAIRQHLQVGTPREQVLKMLGNPESRWPDNKAFSYWLGYPKLFHGLDGDKLHVFFGDDGCVIKAEIVDE